MSAASDRAQRALLETRLAWGDKKPKVTPPTQPKKIKYNSDKRK